jgi:diguanylate cyclase (GGDEF)-like protein/PAS domain S-box-containing protein
VDQDEDARRRGDRRRRAALEAVAGLVPEILDALGPAVLVLAPDGTVLSLNRAAEDLYLWPAEDAIGRDAGEILVRADHRDEAAAAMSMVDRDGRWSGEFHTLRRDGTEVPVHVTVTVLLDEAGEVVARVGVSVDVSERRAADERLRMLLAHSPVALFAVDAAGVFRMAEGQATRASGVDMASLLGTEARSSLGDVPELVAAIDRALAGAPASTRLEIGGRLWNTEVRPVRERDGSVSGAIGVSLDVTEQVAAERELVRLALHDPLTGLPNRGLALDRLHQALTRRGRRDVAVLFLDVDELKRVNDALGHATGDALLRVHADRLRAMVRGADTVARYAGDEFLVVAEDLASGDEADELADRLLAGIAVPVRLGGTEVVPSVSIGVAVAPAEHVGDVGADELLRDADAAMYQAKRAGRGRARRFDPSIRVDVLARLRTEEELRAALTEHHLVVHYQPIQDLRSGAVAAVEALVRWRHPERGLLAPDQFLEVAEVSGLVAEVDDVVLRAACLQARAWADAAHPVRMAVNLSVHHLRDPTLDDRVRAILDQAALDAGSLVLEVSEAAAAAAEVPAGALERLRGVGVGLSLDGFGTGASSLVRLRSLPIDELKIDRTLVAGVAGVAGAADAAVVAAVVDLAHALGLRVVAEGIERRSQQAALTAMGCELGQGFLLGRPVPADVLTAGLEGGAGGPGPPPGRPR